MPALRELQQQFYQQIYQLNGDLPEQIISNGIATSARFNIYRNNTFTGLSNALANAYPVVQKLVGRDFFRYCAHEYIQQHPSRSGDLADYGAAFADFLAQFEPCRQLAYLPDVARLEHAFNHAYQAAEHPPLALPELAKIPPDQHEYLTFRLHPSASLLQSKYPIVPIWEANQPEANSDQIIDINSGGNQILVVRPQFAVKIVLLNSAEYTLLTTLASGELFGSACEQALQVQEDFDLATAFQQRVVDNTLVGFS